MAAFSGDGGSATAASLNNPWAVSLDAGGNLYISEYTNLRVRRVDAATGIINTVAGTGTSLVFNGDGQQATAANILPLGTAVDAQGNLFIASFDRIRRVDAATGLISTVAGLGGDVGSQADGVQATSANFNGAAGVTLLPNGHLLTSTSASHRVREIYYPAPGGYTRTTVTASNTAPAVLTATVVSSASAPVFGPLAFYESTAMLGFTSVVNGTAAITALNQTPGNHTIYAVYGGNGSISGASTSPDFVESVKLGVNVSVVGTPNPAAPNQTVSFSFSVTPVLSSAIPVGGAVQLKEGATILGTATINSGITTLSTAFIDAGTHFLTAAYSGDTNFASASSSTYSQLVGIPATLILAVLPASPVAGQPVTITVSLSPSTATGTVQFLNNGMPMGPATISSGTASLSTALGAGQHTLTANYQGDASNLAASGSISVTCQNAATISLAVQPATPLAGQPAMITATVAPTSATGAIQFLDGATVLGSATLSAGVASLSTSVLTAGPHTVTASYPGDALDLPASASINVTVKNAAALILALSPAAPITGQSATISATVSPASATGTVQFQDGATVLGTATLSGGVASISTSALTAGSHTLTANYQGDALNAVASGTLPATVKNAATIGLALSPATLITGQPATITATVSPSAATGTVQFLDGATLIGTATLSGGAASLSTTALAAGLHTITASYSGDTLNLPASTSTGAAVKNAASATLVLLPSSPVAGQSATITATIAPSTATGTVQFLDNGSVIGTATLTAGAASLTTNALPAGTRTLTALYSGDALNLPASGSLGFTVRAVTATALTLASAQQPAFAAVTFTAQLSPAAATGTVQFLDGAALLGTVSVSGGAAVLTVSSLAVGTHPVQALYSGSAAYAASASAVANQTIVKAAAALALATTPNPSVYQQIVTVTATISPASATGSVQFFDNGSLLATIGLTGGSATFTPSSLAVGSHSLTATYKGDANFLAASGPALTQTVSQAATSTVLTTDLNPAARLHSVTFTATVASSAATGQVHFLWGSSVLATVNLINGVATYSTSSLRVGSNSITATYLGDTKFLTSTSAVLVETITNR